MVRFAEHLRQRGRVQPVAEGAGLPGVTGTALGTLALAAGAIDDAAAWCVLAIVLASFGGGPLLALKAIGGGIACAAFMTTLAPRLLAPLNARV
jgi:Kef-type K+ transport system membrane component KefB